MADNNLNIGFNTETAPLQAIKLVRTPQLARLMAYWSAGIFMILLLITLLPWTQNIRSSGLLTTLYPEDRPQAINATIAGRIEKWHVREGQRVQKGDTIVSLSEIKEKYFDPALLARLEEQVAAKQNALLANREKEQAQARQLDALRNSLDYSLTKARNKLQQARLKLQSDSMDWRAAITDNEIALVRLRRQENLFEQGLKPLTDVETARLKLRETQAKLVSAENKYDASRNELQNARVELSALQAEYSEKIAKAQSELESTRSYTYATEGEVAKMSSEYASTRVRSGFYQITAPQDGYVIRALKAGLGETIKEGDAVATILPYQPELAAELYVKPMDMPLLKLGQRVRLQFDGWPTLVFSGWPGVTFGTFGGIVAVIDNVDSNGQYRILVTPDPELEPWPEPLRVGTGVHGWAMLKTVPIWYEIWRQMNGFPPDYVGTPAEKGKKGDTKGGKGGSDYESLY